MTATERRAADLVSAFIAAIRAAPEVRDAVLLAALRGGGR